MRIKVGEEDLEVISIFKKERTGGCPCNILTDEAIEIIEKLSQVMATQEEIASCLNTSVDILTNKYNKERFLEAQKKGQNVGKNSLRNAQFQCALKHKNATMLIWLGRQYLGQTDKDVETADVGDREVRVKVEMPTAEDYERVKKLKENLFIND